MRLGRGGKASALLYVLAPVCGELLSGSTPIRAFLNPLTFLYLSGLYGSGALLVLEVARRRALGWRGIVLLGAAYGVLEEGLVVTSWFNPYWPDALTLGAYGRLLELNWVWATHLTLFHAVVSVTVPIALVELLFADVADRPWLGARALRVVAVWLGLVSLVGFVGFGFLAFRERGYTNPPLSYLLAVAAAWLLVGEALRAPAARATTPAPPPSLWRVRAFAFGMTLVAFALGWIGPHVIPVAALTVAGLLGVAAFAYRRIARWSAGSGWGGEQRLALVSGTLGFLIALAPFIEAGAHPSGKDVSGQTIVALAALVALVLLARRVSAPRPLAAPA